AAALEGRRAEFERRRAAAELAERALHRALPAIDACEQAERSWRDTRGRLDLLDGTIERQAQAREEAQKAVEEDKPAGERAAKLSAEVARIDEQLPLYKELEQAVEAHRQAEAGAKSARGAEEAAKAEKRELEGEIEAVGQRLEALRDIDVRLDRAQARYDAACERVEALAGENGIRQRVRAVLSREREYRRERETLMDLTRAASQARDSYDDLYRRFIAGQAGLLADELREKVARDGEAPCPVCGTAVCRDRLHILAVPDADTPDKARVDAAKAAFERREKARGAQAEKLKGLESALDSDREHLVTDAGKWLSEGPTWECLCGERYLDAVIIGARQDCDGAEGERDGMKAEKEKRDSEALRLSGLKAGLVACDEKARAQGDEAQAMETDAARLLEKIEGFRRQLTYADMPAAEAARAEKQAESDRLQTRIDRHRDALKKAGDALSNSVGRRSELEKALEEQAQARDEKRAQMKEALADTSFTDVGAVREALIPMGDMEGEEWLKAERTAQNDYENARENTRKQIEELKARTAGKQPVDLGALQAQIDGAQSAWNGQNERFTALSVLLNNHREVAERAGALRRSLEGTRGAWERIGRLAGMAEGTSGEGGKLSFERYVLGATFQDILQMANRRLNQMSGGRYELMLKQGARRANARSGLDIDVMDYSTDQRRPSESLSGGESFFTSLALALGLSDVVQSRAGGRRLDALFIDEGFGTLSEGYLDKALEVLNQLTEGDRLVGIISHVDKLNESIPQKLVVTNTGSGSKITPVL
ncbi:MAG: hypothetical protein IJ124_05525, partial [Clostridia bacterium]|nr:hypothetical protein [Clostridia bacterium]